MNALQAREANLADLGGRTSRQVNGEIEHRIDRILVPTGASTCANGNPCSCRLACSRAPASMIAAAARRLPRRESEHGSLRWREICRRSMRRNW
jgi:hypothetical protein